VEGWRERLKEERSELVSRIEALARFRLSDAFRQLPSDEKRLLTDQHRHMNAYADVLFDRLKLADRKDARDGAPA